MLFGAAAVIAARRARLAPQTARHRASLFGLVLGEIHHAIGELRRRSGVLRGVRILKGRLA